MCINYIDNIDYVSYMIIYCLSIYTYISIYIHLSKII